MSEATTTRVDLGSEERRGGGGLSGVSDVETSPQEGVDGVEVKKQKQQDQANQIEPKERQGDKKTTITRRLWYGIFLTCGLLLVPVIPGGTAFLILPMQVAGFAMIPLNKKEVKTLLGGKLPEDLLLAPEQKLDDALLHGVVGEGTERVVPTVPGTPIDLGLAATTDRGEVKLVSAADLREFLEREVKIEKGSELDSFLSSRGEISVEQLIKFSEKLPEGELRTIIDSVAGNLKDGRPLTSLEGESELLAEPGKGPKEVGSPLSIVGKTGRPPISRPARVSPPLERS